MVEYLLSGVCGGGSGCDGDIVGGGSGGGGCDDDIVGGSFGGGGCCDGDIFGDIDGGVKFGVPFTSGPIYSNT